MKRFLDHIAESIEVQNLHELKDTCYVFPTQRACRHFEELLKDKFSEHTFWMSKSKKPLMRA